MKHSKVQYEKNNAHRLPADAENREMWLYLLDGPFLGNDSKRTRQWKKDHSIRLRARYEEEPFMNFIPEVE